jgi:hypothetical protein
MLGANERLACVGSLIEAVVRCQDRSYSVRNLHADLDQAIEKPRMS